MHLEKQGPFLNNKVIKAVINKSKIRDTFLKLSSRVILFGLQKD